MRIRHWAIAALLTVAGCTIGPVVGCLARWWWGFDLLGQFRRQYVWLLGAATIVLVACDHLGPAAGAGILLIVHALSLWPFYVPRTAASAGEPALRVVSANVCRGNRRFERLIEFVRRESPDVAVFLELDEAWERALGALRETWPYCQVASDGRSRGLAIFSRLPLEAEPALPLPGNAPALAVGLVWRGAPLTLVAVHPFPPVSAAMWQARNRQCASIAECLVTRSEPTVLIGDLNMTSWSPAFADLIERSGLHDSRLGRGVQPSWPTFLPGLFRIPIDHCLVSAGIRVIYRRIGPDVGSDHLPIIVALAVDTTRTVAGDDR